MAGMFFSLKEAAERLGVAEDQVKQLVKAGKLREFRDGSNLLFKIDEVNTLATEPAELAETPEEAAPAEEPLIDLFEEAPVEEQPAEAATLDESLGTDMLELEDSEAPTLEPMAEVEGTSELNLAPEETGEAAMAAGEDELLFLADDDQATVDGAEAMLAEDTGEGSVEATLEDSGEEISLAAESGVLAAGSDITDMDTALTGEGINVLEESSGGFNVTEDSMAETAVGPAGSTGGEASLEEIEDDVNLDSFGSGSGLLDLSLQADDTSLGGILDEIYTADAGEGAEGEASDAEPAAVGAEGASFEDLTTEVDHAAGEEEMHMPEPVTVMPAAVGAVYAEPTPDTQSNLLGMLLFLPMLALLYTAIVAIGGMRHVTPSILSSVQSMIWYILGGLLVVALIVFAASFMVGREKGEAVARPKKEKKAKAEKPKKEKKAKAEKAAKAEKPAKGKKSFFGKKK